VCAAFRENICGFELRLDWGDEIGVVGTVGGQVLLIWFGIVRRGVDPVLIG
jgi:hypothetical protein